MNGFLEAISSGFHIGIVIDVAALVVLGTVFLVCLVGAIMQVIGKVITEEK